jgi:hypothetical protein
MPYSRFACITHRRHGSADRARNGQSIRDQRFPDLMRRAMVPPDALLDKTVAARGGFVISEMGDGRR